MEEGRRIDFRRVLQQDAAERKAEALAAARANGTPLPASDSRGGHSPAGSFTLAGTREFLAGAPDITDAPLLPAQADEDNKLFYCPRLTEASLQRVTGEANLRRVTTLALHLHSEEQDLAELSALLPHPPSPHLPRLLSPRCVTSTVPAQIWSALSLLCEPREPGGLRAHASQGAAPVGPHADSERPCWAHRHLIVAASTR